MSLLPTLRISGSALTAQRLRMDFIATNIANAETTRTPEGGPYKRRQVYFSPLEVATASQGGSGPKMGTAGLVVTGVMTDEREPRLVHEPEHPDADANGYVAYPNVDVVTEMVDLLSATRAYEANITVVNTAKSMAQRALDIGRS